MKIKDIIIEAAGKLPDDAYSASTGATRFRDEDGIDRGNNFYRTMNAAACHDGKTTDAVPADKMDSASWVEKYNTAHPYTEAEHNMVKGALKTLGAVSDDPVPFSKSTETKDVHKVSPHRTVGAIALNKSKK
jgi:hypothetical protein